MKNVEIIKREDLFFPIKGRKLEISFVHFKRDDYEGLVEITKATYDDEVAEFCSNKYEYYMDGSYYLPTEEYGKKNISMDELLEDAIAFNLGDDSQELDWYDN